MDEMKILPLELYRQLGGAASPSVVDIRPPAPDGRLIVSALLGSAADVEAWSADMSPVMYDALHTWCRSLQHETHNWPATQRRAS